MQQRLFRIAPLAAAVLVLHCGNSTGKAGKVATAPSASPVSHASHHHAQHHRLVMPQPLPGGDTFPLPWSTATPPQTTLLNSFFPGDPPIFDGAWAEPSTIIDFAGVFAQVYLGGTAVDAGGKSYFVEVDARAYQGVYAGADGRQAFGTFCEI